MLFNLAVMMFYQILWKIYDRNIDMFSWLGHAGVLQADEAVVYDAPALKSDEMVLNYARSGVVGPAGTLRDSNKYPSSRLSSRWPGMFSSRPSISRTASC